MAAKLQGELVGLRQLQLLCPTAFSHLAVFRHRAGFRLCSLRQETRKPAHTCKQLAAG